MIEEYKFSKENYDKFQIPPELEMAKKHGKSTLVQFPVISEE